MRKDLIRFELVVDAGNGAQKAGDILITAFAKRGNHVYIEPMIPAEISPPKRTKNSMSGVVIRVSSRDITNIGNDTDVMLIGHEILLDRRLEDKEYNQNGIIFLDMGDEAKNKDAYAAVIEKARLLNLTILTFNRDDRTNAIIQELNGNGKNMFYLGMLTFIFSVEPSYLRTSISQTFKKLPPDKLEKNLEIFENGYRCAQTLGISYEIPTSPVESNTILMDGNMALSMGIIDAGIKLYCGYPITPASSIMHTLAKVFPQYGGMVHQAEDEISAIGAAIGSYFVGMPSITATAGPGLSLKQEFIGLATSTEVPLIVVNVQRGGPSTGLPTKTEQSDLPAAVFGSHGDNTKIVLSVSNVVDCFYAPHVARYLTEKLRVPVIILSDYLTSVSYKVFKKPILNQMETADEIQDDILARFGLKRLSQEIEMVKANQSVPGEEEGMRRVTGLNTDREGQITYTSDSNRRSHVVRNQKLQAVREAFLAPPLIGGEDGDLLVIGWGSTAGAIEEAVLKARAEGLAVSGLTFKVVYPLPMNLSEIFNRFKKVITAEIAYGDAYKPTPLAMLLRSQTLTDVVPAIAEPTGRPIKPKQVLAKIKELVA